MRHASKGVIAAAAAMLMTVAGAQAFDDSRYPQLSGQWKRPPGVSDQYDPMPAKGQLPPDLRCLKQSPKQARQGASGWPVS